MTRRAPLQTLAQTVLVAILTCTLLPAPVLAGQGNGKGHRESQGHGENQGHRRSEENREPSEGRHGNGNGNGKKTQQREGRSPQDAAQRARSQYGGQVLKVQPAGGGYQVRLLQDDGRVVTVPIKD